MKILAWLLALIELSTCASIWGKDSKLNPGRIVWPKETWVNTPIQASQTNAGETVTFTFSFRVSTALSNGLLEIGMPSDLSASPLYIASSFEKNQDIALNSQFTITLPYFASIFLGPVSLITRSSSTGKIYDVNYLFGYIKLESPIWQSALTVTNAAINPIIGSNDTLYFTFDLTQNLWKFDIFEIVPEFTYSISSAVTCASVTLAGVPNILYGPKGDNNLLCVLAAQSSSLTGPQYVQSALNSIYIYGLAKDVYIPSNPLSVQFSVSTFNYPLFAKYSNQNYWKINIWRWGTTTLLASYAASNGPTTLAEGSITASWAPISGLPAYEVVSGMTIFTKVTFTAQHSITAGGIALIYFINADPNSASWWSDLDGSQVASGYCFVISPISAASCAVINHDTAEVTFINNHFGPVSIALLLILTTGAKISSIYTTNGNWNIDFAYDLASWPFSTTNTAFADFRFHGYEPADTVFYPGLLNGNLYAEGYLVGADTSVDLYWMFRHAEWTASTTITINLPYSNIQEYNLPYIGNDYTKYEVESDLTSSTPLFSSAKGIFRTSENTVSVEFTAPVSNSYYIMAFGGPSTSLPYVASNLGTFYECYATATTSSTKEIGSSVFSVLIKDYYGLDIFVRPLCYNYIDSRIPLYVSFYAKIMDLDFTSLTNNFVLEVQLENSDNSGIGLTPGSIFPLSSSVSTATAVLESLSYPTIIAIRGLGFLPASGSPVNIFLPTVANPWSLFSILSVYYIAPSYPNIKNYLYRSSTTVAFSNSDIRLNTGYTTSSWDISSTGDLVIHSATYASQSSQLNYIGIGLPKGFSVSNPSFSIGGTEATTIYSASNANGLANGGFVIGINESSAYFYEGWNNIDIIVTGLTPPGYSGANLAPTNSVAFIIFVAYKDSSDICLLADNTSIIGIVNTGSLSSAVTCSSSSLAALGPDSVDSTMTITITTIHKIPKNGYITLILDQSWTYFSSACTVSGLTNLDNANYIQCNIISNFLTITQFSEIPPGLIAITMPHVIPSNIAGIYNCVSTVYTQDSAGNCIDYADGLTQDLTIIASGPPGSTSSNL